MAIERGAVETNTTVKGLGRHWSWEGLVSLPLLEQTQLRDPDDVACACWDGEEEPE